MTTAQVSCLALSRPLFQSLMTDLVCCWKTLPRHVCIVCIHHVAVMTSVLRAPPGSNGSVETSVPRRSSGLKRWLITACHNNLGDGSGHVERALFSRCEQITRLFVVLRGASASYSIQLMTIELSKLELTSFSKNSSLITHFTLWMEFMAL